jgi:hypothetical protein
METSLQPPPTSRLAVRSDKQELVGLEITTFGSLLVATPRGVTWSSVWPSCEDERASPGSMGAVVKTTSTALFCLELWKQQITPIYIPSATPVLIQLTPWTSLKRVSLPSSHHTVKP